MHQNAQLIQQFYSAFQQKDYKAMASCYHADVVFNDVAFSNLDYNYVTGMWEMLLKRGKDLKLVFEAVEANDTKGSAHWTATYTFSMTGRKVVNSISASFEFKDGLIIQHTDSFDFKNWAKQAFGWKGSLFGGMDFFQKKVRDTAMRSLEKFLANKN